MAVLAACCMPAPCSSVTGRPGSSAPVDISGPHPCWTLGAAGSPGNTLRSTLPALLGATRPLSVSWGARTWRGRVRAVGDSRGDPAARMLTVSGRCSHSVSGGARQLCGTPDSEVWGLLRRAHGAQDGLASPPLRCFRSCPEQQLSCHRPAAPLVPAVAASSLPHAAVACRDPSPGFAEASRPFPSLSSVTSACPEPFFSLRSLSGSQPFSQLLRGMLPITAGGAGLGGRSWASQVSQW